MSRLLRWAALVGLTALFAPPTVSADKKMPDSVLQHCPGRICPLPKCESCPSVEELRFPGVGIALETSHGAIVLRLHDGTYHNVALIEGDRSYVNLLQDLATGPNVREPDHIDTHWEEWQYVRRRTTRLLNKLFGRPATPEIAVLAAMVSDLLNAAQQWLGDEFPITAAVLTSPDRIRLSDEEVNDIFEYLKIQNLMADELVLDDLYTTAAAYVGYGEGLCSTYIDEYECEEEECHLPYRDVLHVDLNRDSLSGTIKKYMHAIGIGRSDEQFVDFELGYSKSSKGDSRTAYWPAVSTRIRDFALLDRGGIDQILLTGPSATDPRFQEALRTALHDLVEKDVLAVLDDSHSESQTQEHWKEFFSFATAQGAAEMAKRMQEGPVKCAQTDECRQRREDARSPALRPHGSGAFEQTVPAPQAEL